MRRRMIKRTVVELAYRTRIKPSVIGAYLPFGNFPEYERRWNAPDHDEGSFPFFD